MSWLRTREIFEKEEAERLAPVAVKSMESRGRVVAETDHAYRTAFQRDRDRIVHSRAFRRLEYKTQVFVYHEQDHFRNRLTHTLEGAQIARTIARALRLNEELAEAIALAHDLGHTPFGHAGERALARVLVDAGGFEHNRQTLRVVDLLEERYPDFRGLNLTLETREGLLKHGSDWDHPVPLPAQTLQRSLEAQAADQADEIAYLNHDIDDGLRSGLLSRAALDEIALWCEAGARVEERFGVCDEGVKDSQTIITLINGLVTDLVEASAERLAVANLRSVDEVRAYEGALLSFSAEVESAKLQLKRFLLENLYQHPEVAEATRRAERMVGDLYRRLREEPSLLPTGVRARFESDGEARAIADYVAGMTDRFAHAEHQRVTRCHDTD